MLQGQVVRMGSLQMSRTFCRSGVIERRKHVADDVVGHQKALGVGQPAAPPAARAPLHDDPAGSSVLPHRLQDPACRRLAC